jgi:hypothetical protein
MLSKDDKSNGTTFILKLLDTARAPVQWVASLRGDTAVYWYEVYRRSDWAALRAQGGDVFHDRVTEAQAEHVRRSGRCIVIHTPEVKAEEIVPRKPAPKPLQPDWENDGGSLAPLEAAGAVHVGARGPTEHGGETGAMST